MDYLIKYDKLTDQINDLVTMENTRVDLLIKFIHRNNGRLPKTKGNKFFEYIKEDQASQIEALYQTTFKPDSED